MRKSQREKPLSTRKENRDGIAENKNQGTNECDVMIISSTEIQEAFDGRNYYIPSFFRIKLGVFANLMDVPNIPFGSFAVFFHEYVHYLQDVTTLYGLMNLSVTTYFVRSVAHKVVEMSDGEFDVPQEIEDDDRDFGFRNLCFRKYYVGSSINPKHKTVDVLKYEVLNDVVKGQPIEYVQVEYCDKVTGTNHKCVFGGNILTEGMAYMTERRCYQSVFSENGCEYPDAADYPYMMNWKLAEIIYPELAKYLEIIVGVADIALLTYNPGLTFVRFLEYLKENDYAKTLNGKGYLDKIEDCDNLYKIGYEFTSFSIEKLTQVQDYVYNEIAEYFKMPIAVELNDWVSRVWEKAKQLRKIAPHYILDVILGYWGDVRNNKVFCSIYLGLGTPLVINADDEGTIVPPEGFKPSENFMPGLYWAIDEIRRIFGGDSCAKECLLKGYCSWSSTQEGSNIIVNERCDTAPWLRAKEDMDFCPVGAIWRHWGLTEHTPRFKDDA